jgi:hypothetical protein
MNLFTVGGQTKNVKKWKNKFVKRKCHTWTLDSISQRELPPTTTNITDLKADFVSCFLS